MVDNAYLPPDTEPSSSVGQKLALRSVLLWGLKCLVSYFAGVVVCVVATPVDVNLGGGIICGFFALVLWIGYPLFYLASKGLTCRMAGKGSLIGPTQLSVPFRFTGTVGPSAPQTAMVRVAAVVDWFSDWVCRHSWDLLHRRGFHLGSVPSGSACVLARLGKSLFQQFVGSENPGSIE